MDTAAWKAAWEELVQDVDVFLYDSWAEQREAELRKALWAELVPDVDVFTYNVSCKFRFDQVNHKDNRYFHHLQNLDKILIFKRILADPRPTRSELSSYEGKKISMRLAKILRDELPSSGLQYSCQDGSVDLSELAWFLDEEEEKIFFATSVNFDKNGKKRFVVYEELNRGYSVFRICALGGHFFRVFSPPGHYPIGRECAKLLGKVLHRSDAGSAIMQSRVLRAMKRPGGVNFSLGDAPGYRDDASHLITVNLKDAIEVADFMHNRLSGLVFGLGRWKFDKSWWDGIIPYDERFMTISEV